MFLFFSLPVFAASVEPLSGVAVVTSDKLNVRSGPSTNSEVIGSLTKDESVDVVGLEEPDWYVIEYEGQQGYIYSDYVIFTPEEEIETDTTGITKQYTVIGLIVVIFLLVGIAAYTFISMKRDQDTDEEDEEEASIPISDHDDTNMHLGEVTYDTYRLDIDPSFFETTTVIPQPESVAPDEEWSSQESGRDIRSLDTKLEEASAQIEALKREVAELKNKKTEE
jgi:uncharacterized protein YraI